MEQVNLATDTTGDNHGGKHLHISKSGSSRTLNDLITEYMLVSGKAPDWFWQAAGRLAGKDSTDLMELLETAFEAGAYITHEQPKDLDFEWIDDELCERESRRRVNHRTEGGD